MEIIILHSAEVEASRVLLGELGLVETVDLEHDFVVPKGSLNVRVITKHALATAACPNFSSYPTIVVVDEAGARAKSGVTTWTECVAFINDIPAVQAPARQSEFTRLEFLSLFSEEEKVSLKALESTDPTVALFWEEYRTAETIRLDDPRTVRAIDYLSAQGYLAPGRKEQILGL